MQHSTSTALAAGAQDICVQNPQPSLPGMGSIIQQPGFAPVLRREIMAAVNTCSRDLGLRQAAVVVLDALLSCLPCQGKDGRDAPVTPATLLTVYASNETLCFRAKGLTDRQLRRHLETLESAGLIRRRDSANGKRFPVLQKGKVIGAFGLDLSPLFARSAELLALAQHHREEAEELRGLRAQILHLRASCTELHLDEAASAFIDGLRNLLRRVSLTLTEAQAVLAQLTGIIQGQTAIAESIATSEAAQPCPAEPESVTPVVHPVSMLPTEKPAADGQYDRHNKAESKTIKKPQARTMSPDWDELTEVKAFYPKPRTADEASRIAFDFGRMLRISQSLLAEAAQRLGLWELLRLEDRMARRVDEILSPDAYLRSALPG